MSIVGPARPPSDDVGRIRRLLSRRLAPDERWIEDLSDAEFAGQLSALARRKRLAERWMADPSAREAIAADPGPPPTPREEAFARLLPRRWFRIADAISSIADPRFARWRERQIARCAGQLPPANHATLIHAPFAVELTRGCSVGCWFCAVSPGGLESAYAYTPENARTWREVLAVLRDVLGPAAGAGFCYWATDPLDNPDYEAFCRDFHEALGLFPQTTTALALRDPTRTRGLLRLSRDRGCLHNRFSVLSVKRLDRIHAEFTAEELTFVELLPQNREGAPKYVAGRARDRVASGRPIDDALAEGTPACVSGFLLDMIGGRVRLVAPSPPDERNPFGFVLLDERTFADPGELRSVLEAMIARSMPLEPGPDLVARFRPDLAYEPIEDGFRLGTKWLTRTVRGGPEVRRIGEFVRRGDRTFAETIGVLAICGSPEDRVRGHLQSLWQLGVLEEGAAGPRR